MVEKEKVFSSRINYEGIVNFQEFYKFCYDWLTKQVGLILMETSYVEKIKGDAKEISIDWIGEKAITDYFKFEIKIEFRIFGLKTLEIVKDGIKTTTNKGRVEMQIIGSIVKDYEGKFEKDAIRKFLRSIYEKWIIAPEVQQYAEDIFLECDEFAIQAKSFLDLEGKKV